MVGLWVKSGVQLSRSEVSRFVFLGRVEFRSAKVGPPLCLKTLERIRSRAWRGQERDLDPGGTPWLRPDGVGGFNTIFVKMRQNAHFETTTTCKTSKIVVEAKEKYVL